MDLRPFYILSQFAFGAWLVAIQPKAKWVNLEDSCRGPDWARTSDPALIKRML